MSVPTTSWDETSPANSDNASAGDDRIRELKTQIREVIDVDHDFPSSGQAADVGQHKKVTLQEQADLGTGAVSATILGSQTVSGKGELVYTDEDDNDIQFSNMGTPIAISAVTAKTAPVLADAVLLNDSEASNVSKSLTLTNLLKVVYPVGAVVTFGVSTNPATLFGFGTWTAIAGKVIVGIDATQTEFDTLNETGGAKTHTLTIAEIPAHTHTYSRYRDAPLTTNSTYGYNQGAETKNTGSTGGGEAHNNLQPYIVKYVWERTA